MRALAVERFRIDSTSVAPNAFQGRVERRLVGAWEPVIETLPANTLVISMDQPLARLAFSLLEPRSDDGLTAWAFLDDEIERGDYPIMRARVR